MEDWQNATEYHHSRGIRSIYPEPNGTQLIFIDEKTDAFIYNPVRYLHVICMEKSFFNHV